MIIDFIGGMRLRCVFAMLMEKITSSSQLACTAIVTLATTVAKSSSYVTILMALLEYVLPVKDFSRILDWILDWISDILTGSAVAD